jgi:hypothetical protein
MSKEKDEKTDKIIMQGKGKGVYISRMPLYTVVCNNKGEILVGGGGGASKTGIPNGIVCVLCFICCLFGSFLNHFHS